MTNTDDFILETWNIIMVKNELIISQNNNWKSFLFKNSDSVFHSQMIFPKYQIRVSLVFLWNKQTHSLIYKKWFFFGTN